MELALPDTANLITALVGALIAGFVSGFAGFGTGLVSAGLWFHALPAAVVPPLVVLASVAGQLIGLFAVRRAFDWMRVWPYLAGGIPGVPIGVWALSVAPADVLRMVVGVFLTLYAAFQLAGGQRIAIGDRGGKAADGVIGVSGGILGGFAGLSGALPLVWLQMRGGDSASQRAIYQPFNLIVLMLAGVAMTVGGQMTGSVLSIASVCLPMTVLGAWIGVRTYRRVSERMFRRVVLWLLLVSGAVLIVQFIL
jgi:uncharacterized membrane protein YfcA